LKSTSTTGWAKCDTFCNHTVGGLVEKHPESVSEVESWAKSENRWLKRAAAVLLLVPAKKGEFLQEVFAVSATLLSDEDDMVQKGYGWLLKEASTKHQKEVFNYVLKNRKTMPRTALRYAIELMPKELMEEAMEGQWTIARGKTSYHFIWGIQLEKAYRNVSKR
jgi:3-methyladenine DNA glycosylase AlkD